IISRFKGLENYLMKLKLLIILSTFSLSACVTELSNQGSMVAEMSGRDIAACSHLGVIDVSEGMTWSVADDRRSALNKLRNEVAMRGGNAFVINDRFTTVYNTSIQADAYKCN
ncbi:MAG: DUF4156 domain-containing protein, partial [Candidatus Puniceispirillaceae bacterium]